MKISTNWLRDYVDHGLSTDELAERLTMAGLEVEEVASVGPHLVGVVVGHVLDVKQHPNADRLTVCSVDIGESEPVQIICGASNVAADQKVPVAPTGVTLRLPSKNGARQDVKIKKTKIRGEVSFGMICAEDELGLSEDHSGIMVLNPDAEIGSMLEVYLSGQNIPKADVVMDIAITPNRPDAICHIGVARDVAAIAKRTLELPPIQSELRSTDSTPGISIQIDTPGGCPTYAAVLVNGVSIAESPPWMQQRLTAVGLRPRNNIVDITNYVMYELGQPLHAFDYDRLAGSKIRVHETTKPSTFTTLDDLERELPTGTLMIADGDRDVAIAGIMGGQNSEVSDSTVNVLIESAYFDPSSIRRTSKALQLQTDASYRFERGVDPTGQLRAAVRAAELMAELARGVVDTNFVVANPFPYEERYAPLRPSRVEHVLGLKVATKTIIGLLSDIGFIVKEDGGQLFCEIPPFRPDIEREIDVIEEVARLVGYDSIPEPKRSSVPNQTAVVSPQRLLREKTGNLLAALGYKEVVTNSMLSREVADAFFDPVLPGSRFGGELVETLNPVSREMSTLRSTNLAGVLRVASHNQNRGQTSLKYFEFGNTQVRVQTDHSIVENYTERECLLILDSGVSQAPAWDTQSHNADIFDIKGVSETILSSVHLPDIRFDPVYEPSKVTVHRIDIYSGKEKVGVLGELSGVVAKDFDVREPVFFAEFDWSSISAVSAPFLRQSYETFSKHPGVDRDIAVTVSRNQAVGPMLDTIKNAASELLQSVSVFDLYAGDQIESELKSVAFALAFGADRTLRDKEVDEEINRIISSLENHHGANLRQ